jgi:hypothetical protein
MARSVTNRNFSVLNGRCEARMAGGYDLKKPK